MKTYILILFLSLTTTVSFSQTTSIIDSIVASNIERSDFEFIEIPISAYSTRVVGLVKDNQIYIIEERVDLKNTILITNFYYNNSKLIYINEEEHSYDKQNDTLKAYRLTTKLFEGKYYFYNDKLIDSKTTGEKLIPDEITLLSQSKEEILLSKAEEYSYLLKNQMSKKEKNVIRYKIDIDKIKSITPKDWIVTTDSTNTILLTKSDSV